MIALKDDLPLIQFDDGHCLSFERTWLVHSLVCAGRKAGYSKWWLAEHVAESVAKYLFLEFEENVLEIPRLTRAVKSVLQAIGYAEVAERFVPCPPPVHVSLLEMAHAAGSGYELAFFEMLGRKIEGLVAGRAIEIQLSSLEPCV
ncbi:MAG: hypothetical protein M3O82_03785, partial [Verrucomicrobiota bacterium]|nr:hypothetical protein [Verrucomicrobiota bacterium]